MPRRHGWLNDYHYQLDQGPDRRLRDDDDAPRSSGAPSPVTVNININLGDLIDKLVSKKVSAKEALNEAIERRRQQLTEDE